MKNILYLIWFLIWFSNFLWDGSEMSGVMRTGLVSSTGTSVQLSLRNLRTFFGGVTSGGGLRAAPRFFAGLAGSAWSRSMCFSRFDAIAYSAPHKGQASILPRRDRRESSNVSEPPETSKGFVSEVVGLLISNGCDGFGMSSAGGIGKSAGLGFNFWASMVVGSDGLNVSADLEDFDFWASEDFDLFDLRKSDGFASLDFWALTGLPGEGLVLLVDGLGWVSSAFSGRERRGLSDMMDAETVFRRLVVRSLSRFAVVLEILSSVGVAEGSEGGGGVADCGGGVANSLGGVGEKRRKFWRSRLLMIGLLISKHGFSWNYNNLNLFYNSQ